MHRSPSTQENRNDHAEFELLEAVAAGDPAAVRQLFRAHVGRVHRHVARILGPTSGDVEDVVQQVFLAALAGAAGFQGGSSVGTWLLGIATRRALDEARRRWRRGRWGRVRERVGLGAPPPLADAAPLLRAQAERALARLTPEQRTVFLLKEVEGHTFAEISAMTGIGISTLHARLEAARKRLDREAAQAGEVRRG